MGPEERKLMSSLKTLETLGLSLYRPTDSLVNWEVAAGIAFDIAGPTDLGKDRRILQNTYSDLWQKSQPQILTIMSLSKPDVSPLIGVLDRKEWIVANLDAFRYLVGPLADLTRQPAGRRQRGAGMFPRRLSQLSVTAEVGLIFGYLSRHVMAQFDWVLPRPQLEADNFLYFVEPNIEQLVHKMGLPDAELRAWLMLHEAVHFHQFAGFPWVRGHLNELLTGFIGFVRQELEAMKVKDGTIRRSFLLGPAARAISVSKQGLEHIQNIQAFMAFLEGHSDYVMIQASHDLPHNDILVSLLKRRGTTGSWVDRWLGRLLGVDVKMSQYRLGRDFVEHVVESRGWDGLNRAWQGAANLPTLSELKDPEVWLERTR